MDRYGQAARSEDDGPGKTRRNRRREKAGNLGAHHRQYLHPQRLPRRPDRLRAQAAGLVESRQRREIATASSAAFPPLIQLPFKQLGKVKKTPFLAQGRARNGAPSSSLSPRAFPARAGCCRISSHEKNLDSIVMGWRLADTAGYHERLAVGAVDSGEPDGAEGRSAV